jgi:hypothetical protein
LGVPFQSKSQKAISCQRAVTRQIVQHTKKKRIITKARNTENTKGKSLDGLMNIKHQTSNEKFTSIKTAENKQK